MADIAPAVTIAAEEDVPVLDLATGTGAGDEHLPVLGEDGGAAKLPKHAVLLPDRRVHLKLLHPVALRYRSDGVVREEPFDALTMRRLTGRDMRQIDEAERGDKTVTALAMSTDIPAAKMHLLYDRMDAADIQAAGEVLGFFLESGAAPAR